MRLRAYELALQVLLRLQQEYLQQHLGRRHVLVARAKDLVHLEGSHRRKRWGVGRGEQGDQGRGPIREEDEGDGGETRPFATKGSKPQRPALDLTFGQDSVPHAMAATACRGE